jgi:hypothetical protein
MLFAQTGIHHLAHTPHLSGGLLLSFCLAAVSAAFSGYAMRNGAMLGGSDQTTICYDLQALPRIFLHLLLAAPIFMATVFRKQQQDQK